MKKGKRTVICSKQFCRTKRTKPFVIEEFTLDYEHDIQDRELINNLLKDAEKLARDVTPYAANDSLHTRDKERILANSIAGVVSEYFWKYLLNYGKEYPVVQSTHFVQAATQIDLEVCCNHKRIEVRSSFPRNGVEFAICHPEKEFDILGPYSNDYKIGEVHKDYYVRCLFHLQHPTDIITGIKKSGFKVFLTGGATWDMMNDPNIYIEKAMVPEDSIALVPDKTIYRVVPFHNAMDTKEVYVAIENEHN